MKFLLYSWQIVRPRRSLPNNWIQEEARENSKHRVKVKLWKEAAQQRRRSFSQCVSSILEIQSACQVVYCIKVASFFLWLSSARKVVAFCRREKQTWEWWKIVPICTTTSFLHPAFISGFPLVLPHLKSVPLHHFWMEPLAWPQKEREELHFQVIHQPDNGATY